MALTLADLRTTTAHQPPRFLIHGPPGLGKTTLATEFPSPVVLDVENGLPPGMNVPNFAELAGYDAVMEAITVLYNEDHDFQTVIIDTLDRFEPMLWTKACEDNNWASIEMPGYGKGYVEADKYWRDFLGGLNALRRDKGMAVITVAHSEVKQIPSPTSDPYPSFDIRLHKRALALVQDEVDAILFLNREIVAKTTDAGFNKKHTHAEGGGTRWIYTDGRPAFTAKNRYGFPEKFIFKKGDGFATLAPYLSAPSGGAKQKPEAATEPVKAAGRKVKEAA